MHCLLTEPHLIFFPLRCKALNHCLQHFKVHFSLIQVVKFQLVMWTVHRLLMCVYLSLDFPAGLTGTLQRGLCTGWGQWQLGGGDSMDLLFLLSASPSSFSFSFTTIITAFVPSSSCIVHNFVRCYRKHYRMKLSGKQL